MDKMLTELCGEINNYFWRQKITGKFKIENGSITVPQLKDGQYFRVIGSIFNDGVHQYPADGMTDEEFEGAIWSMAVPQAVIDLALEIQAWQEKYNNINSPAMSPYNSESFGNYSYSKGTAATGTGNPNTWQSVFSDRVNKWRKLRGVR